MSLWVSPPNHELLDESSFDPCLPRTECSVCLERGRPTIATERTLRARPLKRIVSGNSGGGTTQYELLALLLNVAGQALPVVNAWMPCSLQKC